ncbi:TetR/AcrR family transcriptional regulator [Nonomuraea sp. NPDC050451]|uniref:TetR/AcrR family transcriptional regulator n=1 Tax=Nonomuraea sp. NPDC050451 TaxID=3364364 RepID=UPI0037BA00F6
MDIELPKVPEVLDRRMRRSRSALLLAAVHLLTERGTSEVSVTELAEAADVSRRVLYQHFGDRDGLLIAAAIDLVTRELLPRLPQPLQTEAATVEIVSHIADHRPFYRALLTGSCAYAATKTMSGLFRPFSMASARELFGDLDDQAATEVADYFTGATVTAVTGWLVDGPAQLDPEEFAERLHRIQSVLTGAPADTTQAEGHHETTVRG